MTKKLWQVLRSALHSSPEAVLPSHESKKCLADQFVTFFSDNIAKIRNSFSSSDSFTFPPPPEELQSVPPNDRKSRPVYNTGRPGQECVFARCRLVHTSCLNIMTSSRLFCLAHEVYRCVFSYIVKRLKF